MAKRLIKTQGDPILKKVSREVTNFDERLFTLLDDMRETLYSAGGVGLAAVQVGVLKRVIVVDCSEDKSGFLELINPQIIETDGEQQKPEGCLSVPNVNGVTSRPEQVVVKFQNRNGEFATAKGSGLLARCFCHEIDHLDGILFVDRLAQGEKLYDVD